MKKFLNVPLVEFLQKVVDRNTETYSEDFKLDKEIFAEVANGGRLQGDVWLWISRQHGTECMSEQEVFVKNSPAYTHWCYFANDFVSERIKAYTVEVHSTKDNVVYGNIYELDYKAHVTDVINNAVEVGMVHKIFQDGYVDQVVPERSCYGYYVSLVEKHGAIVDSLWAPKDEGALVAVLAEQKRARDKFPLGKYTVDKTEPVGVVEDLLSNATQKSKAAAHGNVVDAGR